MMHMDWSTDCEILERLEKIDIELKNNQQNIFQEDFIDYGETYFFVDNCLKIKDGKLVIQHNSWYSTETVKKLLKNIEDFYKTNKEDYYYEIMDKNDNVLDSDYVCLESAIEYALKNGGYIISKLWMPLNEDGGIDYSVEVTAAEIVWERRNQ